METKDLNLNVSTLGECRIPSPMETKQFVHDRDKMLYHHGIEKIRAFMYSNEEPPSFEMAGPRENIYFDPSKLKCGIVTCGGLSPGLNDVIRAVVMVLWYRYGVREILGLRYGFEGLIASYNHEPVALRPELVEEIHKDGGTILGTSRGPQDVSIMADFLLERKINMLFTVGGDGTQRAALVLSSEIKKKGEEYRLLKLKPLVAPIKVGVFPLISDERLVKIAQEIDRNLRDAGISTYYDDGGTIGRRYARMDEIGTPFCITVDHESLEDNTVTIRDRDTTKQERKKIEELVKYIKEVIW